MGPLYDDTLPPRPLTVRRRANRTAHSFGASAHVHSEVGRRLLEHLEPIRLTPSRVLDLGCGTGAFVGPLAERYPRAAVIALDFARKRLEQCARTAPRWFRRQHAVCADASRIPLADNSIDLIFGNLLLPFLTDPDAVFLECARVLRHGGLVMLSGLGPDTLMELRALIPDATRRIASQPDMHDTADRLLRSGFSDVVADTERLTASYDGPRDLFAELRATGSTNAARDRGAHLAAGADLRQISRSATPSPLTVTFEVTYLHAWYLDRRSVEVRLPALSGPGPE